jgi:outer membrane protein TolC
VRAGTALSGEVAALEAERLRVRQRRHEVEASRRAALAVLAELTGQAISATDVLILPAVEDEARRVTRFPVRARPEYALFARRRERLAQQAALAALDTRPRISAFGQLGYGRPGPDFLSDEFQVFGQAGVRLRWTPWDWGTSRRDQEELRFEQQILQTEEAAFTERLRREVKDDLHDIARLEATLRTDDTLVALREQIEQEARSQLENGVVNTADYIERRNDVFEARIARQTHRAELARARVRYLTTLGVDIP